MSDIKFELVDIPIEFKEINPSDFDSKYYNVAEKLIIEPEEGFIGKNLLPILEKGYDKKNTVVINAGVGQGKSHAILEMAKKYSESDEYIVVVAVPYKNLIEQYVDDCSEFIEKNKIFNQLNIENEYKKNFFLIDDDYDGKSGYPMSLYKVHVLTTNALLGNSGEYSLFQARLKIKYFEELQNYCQKEDKKLIIIFDEIHDSIHNFREELIINLWNYQGIIQKIYTVSATYNEASKEVIKYLSELTERNIQIIESKRVPFPEKQSRLHIYYYSGMYIERDKHLLNLLAQCLKNPKNLDIMSYSKNLLKTFISKPDFNKKHKEVNHLLYPKIDDINKCYADIFDESANQKYDSSKLNIGTNFTTGVNIKKENHNYIVVFPKEVNIEYFNNKGVFTNGYSSIVQTLARQRKNGDIHIFLPYPTLILKDTLPYNIAEKETLFKTLDLLPSSIKEPVGYSDINKQNEEASKTYKKLFDNTRRARKFIEEANLNNSRIGMNRLEFHPKELFILYRVEKHLNQI